MHEADSKTSQAKLWPESHKAQLLSLGKTLSHTTPFYKVIPCSCCSLEATPAPRGLHLMPLSWLLLPSSHHSDQAHRPLLITMHVKEVWVLGTLRCKPVSLSSSEARYHTIPVCVEETSDDWTYFSSLEIGNKTQQPSNKSELLSSPLKQRKY